MGNNYGFTELIRIMREQGAVNNPQTLKLGTVSKKSPLEITTGNLTLDKDDFYISQHLTEYEAKVDIDWTTSSGGSPYAHTHTIEKTKLKFENPFSVGDIVLLYQLDDEKFLIIEKLVEL